MSPGMRLDEYMVKWALEHKLDYDFGNGGEHFKRFWSRDNVIETATYHIAASWWGRAALYLRSKRVGRRVEGNPKPTQHEAAAIESSQSDEITTTAEHLLER